MTRPENEIIYLACPYAHPDTAVREAEMDYGESICWIGLPGQC